MAPEIINKKPYDYRVDIWSLGVLLYELLHREPPYKGRSLPEISNSIQKTTIHYSSNINPDAKELIKLILKQNPNERPPITDMLAHPWVKSHLGKEELAANPPPKVQEVASPRNGKF
jgi:serine/threonine protein kinase